MKSCIGSTWCRYGVQDSTALAIRVEERYRGLRAPHKLKSAVSGCIRECAEAQSKDFGIIATEQGWNLYVCGNGGAQPRHADLLATDVDEATLIRLIDRFLMYYIHTANPLERTARWLERLDGGLEYLAPVVVDDELGIAAQLERDMERLVASYACEWAAVVRDPARRRALRDRAPRGDRRPAFVRARGQKQPAAVGRRHAAAPASGRRPSRAATGCGSRARRRAARRRPHDRARRAPRRRLPLRDSERMVCDARPPARTARTTSSGAASSARTTARPRSPARSTRRPSPSRPARD